MKSYPTFYISYSWGIGILSPILSNIKTLSALIFGMNSEKNIILYFSLGKINHNFQVKGWHTTTISKSYLENESNRKKIVKLLEKDAINCATQFFQTSYFKKILVIGSLPKSDTLQKETIKAWCCFW